jgi:hypothetical protein
MNSKFPKNGTLFIPKNDLFTPCDMNKKIHNMITPCLFGSHPVYVFFLIKNFSHPKMVLFIPGDRGALHCHLNAIATQPIGLVHCRSPEGVRKFSDRLKRNVFFKNLLKKNARPPWKSPRNLYALKDFLKITPSALR